MKKILHLTFFLALISGIAGIALGFANDMTAPVIEANNLKAEKANLKVIYPDVADDAFAIEGENVSDTIEKVFKVEGKGYIFKMKVSGYKEGTSFLVALNSDGTVYDYVAISNGDTQGLGTKVTEAAYRETLKGKNAADESILADTISGATVSSKPVVQGIVEAAKYQIEKLGVPAPDTHGGATADTNTSASTETDADKDANADKDATTDTDTSASTDTDSSATQAGGN